MCWKCREKQENKNTRYCDDWWDDIPHGGYKGDRELKRQLVERNRQRKWCSWDLPHERDE